MSETIPDSPYAAWIAWIDGFAAGQTPAAADKLVPLGDPRLEGYAAERILERVAAALAKRLGLWSKTLDRELAATFRRPGASLGPTLIAARRRLNQVREELNAAPLTTEIRADALRATDGLAANTQRELEEQLRRMPGASAALAEVRRTALAARPDHDVRA